MAKPAPVEPCLIALDIETGGDSPAANPLLAIGACVGTTDGRVLEKRTWCFEPAAGTAMDPRCVAEFWSKHPGTLARIEAAARPGAEQLAAFVAWFDGFDARRVAGLVTNNPAFDLGFLDFLLLRDKVRALPLRYASNYHAVGRAGYRAVRDPSQMLAGQGSDARTWVAARADAACPATHWPEDDAENAYRRYLLASQIATALWENGDVVGIVRGLTAHERTAGGRFVYPPAPGGLSGSGRLVVD